MAATAVTGKFRATAPPIALLALGGFLALSLLSAVEVVDHGAAAFYLGISMYLVAAGLWLSGFVDSPRRARIVTGRISPLRSHPLRWGWSRCSHHSPAESSSSVQDACTRSSRTRTSSALPRPDCPDPARRPADAATLRPASAVEGHDCRIARPGCRALVLARRLDQSCGGCSRIAHGAGSPAWRRPQGHAGRAPHRPCLDTGRSRPRRHRLDGLSARARAPSGVRLWTLRGSGHRYRVRRALSARDRDRVNSKAMPRSLRTARMSAHWRSRHSGADSAGGISPLDADRRHRKRRCRPRDVWHRLRSTSRRPVRASRERVVVEHVHWRHI